jgi:phosphatidylglycerophosphatase GEP4
LKAHEVEEELEIVKKWEKEMMGPILGPLVDKDGKEVMRSREGARDGSDKDVDLGSRMRERQFDTGPSVHEEVAHEKREETTTVSHSAQEEQEPLRILVIGDRMMTDTLLSNRLAKLLPAPSTTPTSAQPTTITPSPIPIPSVISIHTTLLPQPKDVRLLRWLEEKLSKSQLRPGPIDWARYTIPTAAEISAAAAAALPPLTWKERINPFRDTPPLTWHPRSWRPAPLAVGLGSGLWFVSSVLGRGAYRLLSRAWEGEVEVAKALAERAGAEAKDVKQQVGKIETAEAVLEKPAPSTPA